MIAHQTDYLECDWIRPICMIKIHVSGSTSCARSKPPKWSKTTSCDQKARKHFLYYSNGCSSLDLHIMFSMDQARICLQTSQNSRVQLPMQILFSVLKCRLMHIELFCVPHHTGLEEKDWYRFDPAFCWGKFVWKTNSFETASETKFSSKNGICSGPIIQRNSHSPMGLVTLGSKLITFWTGTALEWILPARHEYLPWRLQCLQNPTKSTIHRDNHCLVTSLRLSTCIITPYHTTIGMLLLQH
jgi:hypothetical protein